MLDWKDYVAIFLIVVVSYWLAFCSGLSRLIVSTTKRNKKPRGTISGESKLKLPNKAFIKTSDCLVLFREQSAESTKLAKDFEIICEKTGYKCEFCEADGYDFEVLEHLTLPIVFIIDKSSELHDFIQFKEKDLKYVRAYKRRFLNNLRYSVIECDDSAFSQFIDAGLDKLGASRSAPRCIGCPDENWVKSMFNKS